MKDKRDVLDFGLFMTEIVRNEDLASLLREDNLSKIDNHRIDELFKDITNKMYSDETINKESIIHDLPEPLKAARNFERSVHNSGRLLTRAEIFLKEAQMLANYEDDFDYQKDITRYYPTYQSLSDKELRSYFSWRTKWRKGIKEKTCLSYTFIYIYELIHIVGCTDANDAYVKLTEFSHDYSSFDPYINIYLKDWIRDFVIYYGLDPTLLSDTKDIRKDKAISVLLKIYKHSDDDIFQAAGELAGSALKNSLLTKKHSDVMKSVVAGTLRTVANHYAKKCKNSWIDYYFGYSQKRRVWLFQKAVFCYEKSQQAREIELSPIRRYEYTNGCWYVYEFEYIPEYRKRFLNLIRTIDSLTRKAINFPHPIQQKTTTKWIVLSIHEEIHKWQSIKRKQEEIKINIDLSKLGNIRSDSDVTREKLLTEEEMEENLTVRAEIESGNVILSSMNPEYNPSNDNVGFDALLPQEKRYLQCLLNGTSLSWVRSEGFLPSLLCDSINDKLYCLFEDTVLEDGVLIEDYTEELKKGLCS